MMIPRQKTLSRRTVLRGAGVALGLPWLEAMAPSAFAQSRTAPGKSPVRMAVLYMPNGVNTSKWTPEGQGRDFRLSPTLQPLEDLKDQLLVVSNLWNAAANTGDGHYAKESSLLTCTTITKTLGVDINIHGPSMDQVAAQRVGGETPLPSLELGVEPESTGVDANVGYTRVYGCHIAWSGPTTPLARETSPRSVYARLFRAAVPAGNSVRQDMQLLDRVLEQSKRMRSTLGAADQSRVDEYLATVRSLETRMERSGDPRRTWKPLAPVAAYPEPAENPATHEERVRLMLDLIALAFQSDTTRITTFMFGNAVSGVNFRFLDGVTDSHHEISHHSNDAEKLRQYAVINKWHVEQYAYLLRKLRAIQEGERSLLDNSMILFGSALSDGNRHDPHRLPLALAGRGGGRIASGRHLVFGEDSPAANLYVSMLAAFGTPVERFADSTGPLPGVLA
ncbi:MAG TPA: DUF1552 domain-containing protein [Tepidisphaeraceae bacterium]|nr:DUF1552 domain-containing protein [Tepidisphaeraceae bacterium]